MLTGFEPLKEVKEIDSNIYVSMEYCNKEIAVRDREIEELIKEKARLKAKLQTARIILSSLLNNSLRKDGDLE